MDKNKAIEIAAGLFPSYPTVQKFFITSDGQAFENENDAVNHGNHLGKLEKKEAAAAIVTVNREDVPVKNADDKALKDAQKAVNAAKKEVDKKQAAFDKAKDDKKDAAAAELTKATEALAAAENALAALQ